MKTTTTTTQPNSTPPPPTGCPAEDGKVLSSQSDKYHNIPIEQLTHDQLYEIVRDLRDRSQSTTTTKLVMKQQQEENNPNANKIKKQQKTRNRKKKQQQNNREFDWSRTHKRHIALKIAYFGYNYQGFAAQLHTDNTVEYHLFEALKKTKLIVNENDCAYSRCGRTDKGVSALCQVVGLQVRSALKPPPPPITTTCSENGDGNGQSRLNFSSVNQQDESAIKELDYVRMLNKTLPDDIRVLGWAPVGSEFDARFGCLYRTYKYFFVRGNLDVEAMRKAAEYFIGYHDCRNFCKMNADSVKNFRRKILSVAIQKSGMYHQSTDADESHAIYEIVVCGYSFLWHQIRCMASILFHVGRREEKPEIIREMLDAEKYPRKPQYTIASEFPLCLWDCFFEDIKWINCQKLDGQHEIAKLFLSMWTKNVLKTAMIDTMLSHVYSSLVLNRPDSFKINSEQYANSKYVPMGQVEFNSNFKFMESGPKYVPLLARPTGTSFEEKLEVIANRKKKMEDEDEDEYDGE